jgi:hypothetical protein
MVALRLVTLGLPPAAVTHSLCCRHAQAALDDLRHAHVQLQAEAAAVQQRYKVAADGAASLQLELSTARERNDTLHLQVRTGKTTTARRRSGRGLGGAGQHTGVRHHTACGTRTGASPCRERVW